MSCAALLSAAICATLSGEPRMIARDAALTDDYVQVASVEHHSYRRHRHRFRHWHRRRAPRHVVIYRDKVSKNEARPGPCETRRDEPLVERHVQTERIVAPSIEPAKLVREAFEELSVNALLMLGRARVNW